MSQRFDALCLNVSPAFKCFNRPLLRELSQAIDVSQWEYVQSPDEPCSLDAGLVLLHDYLKQRDRPVHLIGHGISGLLGLLYARRHPERVRSLAMLSVGVYPAIDWQSHYFMQRQLLRCSRMFVLTQTVTYLFGAQCKLMTQRLVSVLEKDLMTSPSPNALGSPTYIPPEGVPVPFMVSRGEYDTVIDPNALEQWHPWFKTHDFQWECPQGRYFFHHSHPHKVAEVIIDFWRSLEPSATPSCKSLKAST